MMVSTEANDESLKRLDHPEQSTERLRRARRSKAPWQKA